MFEFTIEAFDLAEQFRVPVILLGDESTGHLRESMEIPESLWVFERKKKGDASFRWERDKPGAANANLWPRCSVVGDRVHSLLLGIPKNR